MFSLSARWILAIGLVATWLAVVAAGVVSPKSIDSPVTLLFENNLNWTDDANHQGFLLLNSALSGSQAQSACQNLGEHLAPESLVRAHSPDLVHQLQYANFRGDFSSSQAFRLADAAVSLGSGEQLKFASQPSSGSHLPALCTQSSRNTTTGTSLATSSNEIAVTSPSTGNVFTGFRNLKSFRFLGIPYSNNPARWEYSSVSPVRNSHVDATQYGAECVQTGSGDMSETCLFLNIFSPHLPTGPADGQSKLRPVLFGIHGGAFTGGTGNDPTFDGGNMASREDVVMVTINYRLSTVGFLAIPGTDITGNYGLADQITALQWVQQNIQAFGGDPSRVTIWGQSAGAGSVRALLASPLARGLFSAAIPDSNLGGYDYGTTYSLYDTPSEEFTTAAAAILKETNCTNSNLQAEVACLKAVPASTLVNLPDVARYVIVDGKVIIAPELDVTRSRVNGTAASVPVLIGQMADDGAPFIGYPTNTNRTANIAAQLSAYPGLTEAVDARTDLFPTPDATGNATLDMFNLTSRIATDIIFRCIDQATAHSAVLHDVFPAVYYYQFDRSYQTPGFDPNAPTCDAPKTAAFPFGDPNLPYFHCHSGDLYYEFGTLGQFALPFRDANDLSFMQLVMDYFAAFVRSHDPNPSSGFLAAKGFTGTAAAVKAVGTWEKVTSSLSGNQIRRLEWPPFTSGWLEVEQCEVLKLPITFYEDQL